MQKFDFISLETNSLECEECGWLGQGYETEKGFGLLPDAIEIHCPVCGNYFGEITKAAAEKQQNACN